MNKRGDGYRRPLFVKLVGVDAHIDPHINASFYRVDVGIDPYAIKSGAT